ncbi:BrnT family toxin [Candidatus Nitrosacidococcus tergens]|uniref:BrnT family toxin n=1 Tax=Candidatus Nitrosacidococcus tergens TaxID=553981 RepID=A0A7G1Q983_9GAMM|nr:BrnT family toxin [Candidatus Nitrosacidococcus tergens]CAB1275746.1 conserved protein of unknown function [Candidatus Nitrosacidococcus tergens]
MRDYGEHRYITLGISCYAQVLIAVWTLRDDEIRLISSWKANTTQRRQYDHQ